MSYGFSHFYILEKSRKDITDCNDDLGLQIRDYSATVMDLKQRNVIISQNRIPK